MRSKHESGFVIGVSVSPYPSISPGISDDSTSESGNWSSPGCHGIWRSVLLVGCSVLFLLYLTFHLRKNLKKLRNGRSYIMIAYYALLWFSALLNLAWCTLQTWECTPGKVVAWNALSLFSSAAMLSLEISLVGFLLQDNYATGLEALARIFFLSGLIVGVDVLLKAIFVFGFGVPLFFDGTDPKTKWTLLLIHALLLTVVYSYILFVHYSKWTDRLPPRPAFYKYVVVMLVINGIALFSSGLATVGASLGIWLYNLNIICYRCLYLPFLYITFLADFFQEDDLLLDNAYYSEMRDAGFFVDWDY